MKKNKFEVKKMVGVAIFVAIVIVLQMVGSFIRIGAFSVTLVLVPIVIGAAVYGPGAGALLGGAFGAVTLIGCINGVDAGGVVLWTANPPLTAALCMIKGIAAGYVSGLVYVWFSKNNKYVGVFCAAVVCPFVNTAIFLCAMFFLYLGILSDWAAGSDLVYYLFFGIAGGNFVLELLFNIVLCPSVTRVINAVK